MLQPWYKIAYLVVDQTWQFMTDNTLVYKLHWKTYCTNKQLQAIKNDNNNNIILFNYLFISLN